MNEVMEPITPLKRSLRFLAATEQMMPGAALGMEDEESLNHLKTQYEIPEGIPSKGVGKYADGSGMLYLKWSVWDTISADSSPLYSGDGLKGVGFLKENFFETGHMADKWLREIPNFHRHRSFIASTGQIRDAQRTRRLNGESWAL